MSSAVRETLAGYVAGRVEAERVVIAATVAYYRDARDGTREALRPLIDVIDRASPGVVELAGTTDQPGFDVRLAERSFPEQYEPALRRAAEAYLAGRETAPGVIGRLLGAIQRLLSASA